MGGGGLGRVIRRIYIKANFLKKLMIPTFSSIIYFLVLGIRNSGHREARQQRSWYSKVHKVKECVIISPC